MGQRWVGSLAIVLWVSGGASVAARQHVPLTDDQIRAQVEHKLFDEGLVGVKVTVRDGGVVLSGTVPSMWAKDEAVNQARHVSDVRDVTTSLAVTRAESDVDLAAAVSDTLQGSVFLTVFDGVSGRVLDGVLTLTGYVTTPHTAKAIVQDVSRVDGVRDVVNEVEVLPLSRLDDEIRYAVADRLYNAPGLSRYGALSRPPIHIVVKNGHVTLLGIVDSEADRRLAGLLTRQVFGVRDVENTLRVEP